MPASLADLARGAARARPAMKRMRVGPYPAAVEAAADIRWSRYQVEPEQEEEDNSDAADEADSDAADDDDQEEEEEEGDESQEDEEEEDALEEDEDEDSDDEGAEEEADWEEEEEDKDPLPWDPHELRELVELARATIKSLRQSANARHKRADHHVMGRPRKLIGPQTLQEHEAAALRHEERAAKYFADELARYSHCRAGIVNRLGLALSSVERVQLRGKGLMRQEWFLAVRDTVATLQKELYSAVNTLEVRLSENISVRAMRRMRRVMSEVRDEATGKWARLVVARPPKPGSAGGDRSLRKASNKAMGIFPKRPVYAPYVFADDHAAKDASRLLLNGRKMDVAIPSKDGYS